MNAIDTIVAQITPQGRGGVGIIRVSGSQSKSIAKLILGKLPIPRYAEYLPFKDEHGTWLDKGIAIWFPAPHSFTGEDVLELQGHGGQIVLDLLLRTILLFDKVRIAHPGEFSERAFLNEKLDLIQAEAIADLINADSEKAARCAMNSFQGIFSTKIISLIEKITNLRVQIEVSLNFPEEETDFLSSNQIELQLNKIISIIHDIKNKAKQGSALREGIKVVITGKPNVGKSSLLNALAGKDIAIITDIPGTTRDVLREHIYIDDVSVHILDTAGLRDTNNEIERIGVQRAWKEIKQADHILLMVDSTTTKTIYPEEIYPDFFSNTPANVPVTVIRNKTDITGETSGIKYLNDFTLICLSVRTGKGLDILRNHIKKHITHDTSTEGNFLARRRHLHKIESALFHLEKAKAKFEKMKGNEWVAEELRLSQNYLKEITGELKSDDLLGSIFSNFCIGK